MSIYGIASSIRTQKFWVKTNMDATRAGVLSFEFYGKTAANKSMFMKRAVQNLKPRVLVGSPMCSNGR